MSASEYHEGLETPEKCPRCHSTKFNLIDFNNWFHCWKCRLVCAVSKLKDIEFSKEYEVQ